MEILIEVFERFIRQITSATLGFLFAGFVLSAVGSKFRVPEPIYLFCVFMLLMRIGLGAGMAIREADLLAMALPAFFCMIIGAGAVLLGSQTLARLPGIKKDDAMGTAGLFGAVSGSTLAAGMVALEGAKIFFEPWVVALYPFMDIPALVLAIVMANMYLSKKSGNGKADISVKAIMKDTVTGFALSILIIGVLLGLFMRVERVYDGFFDPLFRGFLSVLMLTLGMEAYHRLKELFKVAYWYAAYAFIAPFVHGFAGFGLGYVAHHLVGLSPGGVIMVAIIAASNSDISGPPTIRAGIPSANPSCYIGTSTGLGTVVAIALCIPAFIAVGIHVFEL
ncbi:sodium-dependent bicarbonate transport family permease [Thermodesulfovibrionales bacterium]|nr:sodium-dependent bicarbonate transport family permease [Thermodesulfovibrionales bacterium]